jgi:uncharacterized protein (TIGR02246 family)
MRKSAYAWLSILAVSSACVRATQPAETQAQAEQDAAAIDQIRADYVAAFKAADASGIADLYTEDATVMPGNQPTVSGRSGIVKYNEEFFSQFTPDNIELTVEETRVMGDWALDRGTYDVTATPKTGAETINEHGRYLVLLQRQTDGSWKVARDIDNTDSPPPPPAVPPAPAP